MKIDNLNIEFENVSQIINMGGPYVGELFLNKHKICDAVICDNVVVQRKTNSLFFIKYHLISKWQRNNFFTINKFDWIEKSLTESNLKFDVLYIEEGKTEKEIITYDAFHSEFRELGISRLIESLELKTTANKVYKT